MRLDAPLAAALTSAKAELHSRPLKDNALLLDERGTIMGVSPGAARLLGRESRELQGYPFGIFLHLLERTEFEVVDPHHGAPRTVVARASASTARAGWTEVHFEEPDLPLAAMVHQALHTINDAMPEDQSLRLSVPRLPIAAVPAKFQPLVEECLASMLEIARGCEACLAVYGALGTHELELSMWLTIMVGGTASRSARTGHTDYHALAEALSARAETAYDYPLVRIGLFFPLSGRP